MLVSNYFGIGSFVYDQFLNFGLLTDNFCLNTTQLFVYG